MSPWLPVRLLVPHALLGVLGGAYLLDGNWVFGVGLIALTLGLGIVHVGDCVVVLGRDALRVGFQRNIPYRCIRRVFVAPLESWFGTFYAPTILLRRSGKTSEMALGAFAFSRDSSPRLMRLVAQVSERLEPFSDTRQDV